MSSGIVFERWTYLERGSAPSLIYPDGCRDLLIFHRNDRFERAALTDFDFSPRSVQLAAGTRIEGFRLRPGVTLKEAVLSAIRARPQAAREILGNSLCVSDDIDQAIFALGAGHETVRSVAANSGLSVRSLQRVFAEEGLPPPDFWRLLCRARRAALRLQGTLPLADIASDSGYSDQAHMSRDLVRWFGASPARLRRDAQTLRLLAQPALGNWTGEQISTR